MLTIEWFKLANMAEATLAKQIEAAGTIRISCTISNLYDAKFCDSSRQSHAWLKGCYLAECLGQLASAIKYEVEEQKNESGNGHFHFELLPRDSSKLADFLVELAPALDPDDYNEAEVELTVAALGWSEAHADLAVRFPELRNKYLENADETGTN